MGKDIGPKVTGNAVIQHITKLRKKFDASKRSRKAGVPFRQYPRFKKEDNLNIDEESADDESLSESSHNRKTRTRTGGRKKGGRYTRKRIDTDDESSQDDELDGDFTLMAAKSSVTKRNKTQESQSGPKSKRVKSESPVELEAPSKRQRRRSYDKSTLLNPSSADLEIKKEAADNEEGKREFVGAGSQFLGFNNSEPEDDLTDLDHISSEPDQVLSDHEAGESEGTYGLDEAESAIYPTVPSKVVVLSVGKNALALLKKWGNMMTFDKYGSVSKPPFPTNTMSHPQHQDVSRRGWFDQFGPPIATPPETPWAFGGSACPPPITAPSKIKPSPDFRAYSFSSQRPGYIVAGIQSGVESRAPSSSFPTMPANFGTEGQYFENSFMAPDPSTGGGEDFGPNHSSSQTPNVSHGIQEIEDILRGNSNGHASTGEVFGPAPQDPSVEDPMDVIDFGDDVEADGAETLDRNFEEVTGLRLSTALHPKDWNGAF